MTIDICYTGHYVQSFNTIGNNTSVCRRKFTGRREAGIAYTVPGFWQRMAFGVPTEQKPGGRVDLAAEAANNRRTW
jgi:hypothetical protein